jgi:DNA polymerase III subunit delta
MAKTTSAKSAKTATDYPANVHIIVGSDEAAVKEAATKIVQTHAPADMGDFGLEVIDGTAENSDHAARLVNNAIVGMQTLSLFGGGKVVWLKNANFLDDSVSGKAEATLLALDSLLAVLTAGLPDDVHFVLTAHQVDKRRSFWLKLNKAFRVTVYDVPDLKGRDGEAELEAIIHERAERLGLSFDADALGLFISLSGERTLLIASELEKIDLYLGDERRRVTIDDIRLLIPQNRDGIVFELGSAIAARHPQRALRMLDQLLSQGESGVGILLAGVLPKLRTMAFARDLAETYQLPIGQYDYKKFCAQVEALPEAQTKHLPQKKDGGLNLYPLFLSAQESRNFTAAELRHGLHACLRANRLLVTTGLDAQTVLSQMIVRFLASGQKSVA